MSDEFAHGEVDPYIEEFESLGAVSFRVGEERAEYEAFLDYVHRNKITADTHIDHEAGVITLSRRPFGAFEMG